MRIPAARALLTLTMLVVVLPRTGGGPMAPPAFDAAPRCALKDSGPARLIIDAVTPSVRPGSPLTLTGRIEASSDLGPVTLNVRADGSAHLDGPAELTIGAVKGGERVPFSIPVTFGAARGAVVVSSAGTSAEGEPWEYTTGAYAVPEAGGLTAGTGGYLCVQLTAIERARAAGLMSPEQARSASDDLLKIPGSWDSIPHRPQRLTTDQNQVYASMQNQLQLQPSSGCITVQGTVSWRDENELPHPAFGLLVEVFDEDLFGIEDLLTTTLTDQNGFYSVQVSDDDGLFQGGPDIFVRIRSEGPGVAVKSFLSFDSYHSTSGVHDDTGCDDSPIVENFAAGTGDPGPAFGLAVCGNWIGAYTSNLVGWLPPITVRWPTPLGSTFYNLTSINVLADDRWDWDVLMHEYGHYIQHETGIADNPGGDHSSASCLSETRDSKSTGTLLAWAEGWPTFNGVAAQYQMGLASLSIPRVGDIAYQDTQDQVLTVNLETPDAFGGEDNERGVMRTCWDLIDTGTDSGRDLVTLSDISLFSWIDDANAVNLSQAWGQIQGHLTMGQQLDCGNVLTDARIGPALISPAVGSYLSLANPVFEWTRGVGCSSDYQGNYFVVQFYKYSTSELLLQKLVGNQTQLTLTPSEFDYLKGLSGKIRWCVQAVNLGVPITGPYMSQTRAFKFDYSKDAALCCDPPYAGASSFELRPERRGATVSASVVQGGRVTVDVFNVMGERIRGILDQEQVPGEYILPWDGRDNGGRQVASGMYFCRCVAPDRQQTIKFLLAR